VGAAAGAWAPRRARRRAATGRREGEARAALHLLGAYRRDNGPAAIEAASLRRALSLVAAHAPLHAHAIELYDELQASRRAAGVTPTSAERAVESTLILPIFERAADWGRALALDGVTVRPAPRPSRRAPRAAPLAPRPSCHALALRPTPRPASALRPPRCADADADATTLAAVDAACDAVAAKTAPQSSSDPGLGWI